MKEGEREWGFRLNLEEASRVTGALTWTWGSGAVLPPGQWAARILSSRSHWWSRWRAAPRPSAGYLWCRWQWCWRLRWEQGWESQIELVSPLDLWRAQRPNSLKTMSLQSRCSISISGRASQKHFKKWQWFCVLCGMFWETGVIYEAVYLSREMVTAKEPTAPLTMNISFVKRIFKLKGRLWPLSHILYMTLPVYLGLFVNPKNLEAKVICFRPFNKIPG